MIGQKHFSWQKIDQYNTILAVPISIITDKLSKVLGKIQFVENL